jgi:riboflavin biosynthesis pyrimidine reductase
VRRLLPSADDVVDLDEVYACPADRLWLRANMVMAVDGAFTGPDGLSAGISGPADRRVFATLRRLADVVLVGAGTARAEGYRPSTLPIAVVTGRLDLDLGSGLLAATEHRTIVLTTEAAGADRIAAARRVADVAVCGTDRVEPDRAVAALAERGHRRILCEGGPTLLGAVAAAGLLDELCVTVSPLLVGGRAGLLGQVRLPGAIRLTTGHVLEEDGTLFLRLLVSDSTLSRPT